MKWLSVLYLLFLFPVSIRQCRQKVEPVEVHPTGINMEVDLWAWTEDFYEYYIPRSEYTGGFEVRIPVELSEEGEMERWNQLHAFIANYYRNEREYPDELMESNPGFSVSYSRSGSEINEPHLVYVPPPLEWLQEHVERRFESESYASIELDGEGMLNVAISQQEFAEHVERQPNDIPELLPMQIAVDGEVVHSEYRILRVPLGSRTIYVDSLSDFQSAYQGKLVYRFPDEERYFLIQLPEDFLALTEADLSSDDYQVTIRVEILSK